VPSDASEWSVFIASPGDLEEERDAARKVVESTNATVGLNLSKRIRLSVGSHVQPSFGRPQESINPLVDDCDVFICLVHRRWGSDTGEASSGFKEEYDRAIARRKQSTSPRIALFFKRVDPSYLDDAGPQLNRVMAFRQEIEKEHTSLYREFTDTAEFALQLQFYLADLLTSAASDQPDGSEQSVANRETGSPDAQGESTDEARAQIADLFGRFRAFVAGDAVDGETDHDRLLMVAHGVTPDAGPIPVHVVNRLYRRSKEIVLARGEHAAWLTTFLASLGQNRARAQDSVVPGWRALYDPDHASVFWTLVAEMLHEDKDLVQIGALRVLVEYNIRPDELWSTNCERGPESSGQHVDRWTRIFDNSEKSLSDLLEYLSLVTVQADQPILRAATELCRIRDVQTAVRSLLDGMDGRAEGWLALLPTNRYLPAAAWLVSKIEDARQSMSVEQLRSILTRDPLIEELVEVASRELIARGEVNKSDLCAIIQTKNTGLLERVLESFNSTTPPEIRLELANAVSEIGKSNLPSGAYPRILAALLPSNNLLEMLDQRLSGVDAWVALSLRSPTSLASQARDVFRTDGASLGEAIPDIDTEEYKVLREFLQASVRLGALRVLAADPTVDVKEEVLPLLAAEFRRDSWNTRKEVVLEILKHAEAENINLLEEIRDSHDGILHRDEVADRLADLLPLHLAEEVISSGDTDQKIVALRALLRADESEIPRHAVLTALHDDDQGVRIAAARLLFDKLERSELIGVLEHYNSESTYYYNVIVAFDKALYGPGSV